MDDMRALISIVAEAYREPAIRLAKNPPQMLPETDTCAVQSIAFITDRSPEEVWEIARPFWRQNGGITNAHKSAILSELGYEMRIRANLIYRMGGGYSPKDLRLKDTLALIQKEPDDTRFMISVRDHAIGAKGGDGGICDTAHTSGRVQTRSVYQVLPKTL